MKNLFKYLTVAVVLLTATFYGLAKAAPSANGGSAFPLTFISQPMVNTVDSFNQMLQIIHAQTAAGTNGQINIGSSGNITTYSTSMSSNPLVEGNYQDIPVASANAAGGATVIAAVTGRTVYPGIPTVMVSGTAATATSLKILCSPSQKLLATIPIANLVTSVPVTPFSSTSITPGSALGNGCVSGDAIIASTVGTSMTTTTDIYVNMPFVVQ